MTLQITCELAINGQRVADSAASLAAHTVTALAGLSVQWGRRSRLDQPEPATMHAVLALPDGTGAPRALEDLQAGMPVSVTASYTAPAQTTTVITARPETLTAGSPAAASPAFTRPPFSLRTDTAPPRGTAFPKPLQALCYTPPSRSLFPIRRAQAWHPCTSPRLGQAPPK